MPANARTYRKSPLFHDPEALKWAREKDNRTQASMCEALGISPGHYSEIEKGTRNAPPELLARIAMVLNCPRSFLERKREQVSA